MNDFLSFLDIFHSPNFGCLGGSDLSPTDPFPDLLVGFRRQYWHDRLLTPQEIQPRWQLNYSIRLDPADTQLDAPAGSACRISGAPLLSRGNFTSTIVSRASGKLYISTSGNMLQQVTLHS
jgi:hypothetical protein